MRTRDRLLGRLVHLQHLRGYWWDAAAGVYRSKWNRQEVKESTVRARIENYNQAYVQRNVDGLTDALINDKIKLPDWQQRMAQELKDSWRVNLMVGRGGYDATGFDDYGRMGGRLRWQYHFLNGFAQEIEAGQITEAQIRARATMYAQASTTAYHDGLQAAKRAAGMTTERWVMTPAEHCEDCIAFEAMGWQRIGAFPTPGDGHTRCLMNCKCYKEYGDGIEPGV